MLLLERITHRLRKEEVMKEIEDVDIDSQVEAMAEDREIRMELEKINREFVVTELDGLGNSERFAVAPGKDSRLK